jgi:hypothetical protein
MRFKIDEQREELKKRIDDIALAMIDDTKKHEAKYLQDLKEHFSSFDGMQSLEDKLNEIEATFRQPNLLIQTIQDMQKKQEGSLKDIQLKLNQITMVKGHLKATNDFKPTLSSFNQNEETTSLFGSIKLNGYSNMNSFKSEILKDEQQCLELLKVCEFSPRDKWSLLYRGTRDGFRPRDFHTKCDGHSNTLTILKAKYSSNIFGGYTMVIWDSSSTWKSDRNAFIFSLTNKDNQPLKMKVGPNEHKHAIGCHSIYGPTFGYDIHIANNANTTMSSSSNLGDCYSHPQYEFETDEAAYFLAGSEWFQLDEIEIYQKE